MEKEIVEEIVKERVKENEKLFSEEELNFIKNNSKLIEKIYLLGNIDYCIINGNNLQY